jgi:hypothetical protein
MSACREAQRLRRASIIRHFAVAAAGPASFGFAAAMPRAIIRAMPLRHVTAVRYVAPLREGGSLPAVVEGDDDGLYVCKFRGAGQGPNVLVAEVIAGELARAAGLPVPEIVAMALPADLARTEPDPEIQDLIRASTGLNVALDYLPGATMFDPLVDAPDATLASAVVWLDGLVVNVDRTARNPNLLMWHRHLWLIDHGAALYFHHGEAGYAERARDPFTLIREHVLLPFARRLSEVDAPLAARLDAARVRAIVDAVPDEWLHADPARAPGERRAAYVDYLLRRLAPPRPFLEEALRARGLHV